MGLKAFAEAQGNIQAQLEDNHQQDEAVTTTPKRGRGRPKGSTKDEKQLAQEQQADRDLIDEAFPGIGFNCRAQAVQFRDGKGRRLVTPGELKHIEHLLGLRTGRSIPASRAQAAAEFQISRNTIDPVKEYLEGIKDPAIDMSWEEIGRKVFGPVNDFATTIYKKWMTAAIARVFEPGCSMDWILILVGAQGIGKSMFGRALVPSTSFYGELTSDVDVLLREPQRMNMSWICELPEVDGHTTGKKADREKFKNLISTREDLTRVPYAQYPERMPRANILYGNSNREEFIEDTESRRTFMIEIPEGHLIDFQWIESNRDALWAKAIAEYKSGTSWIWTRKEYEQAHSDIMRFRLEDPIEGLIDEYIKDKRRVTSTEIIRNVLQVPPHLQEKSHSKRVTDLMKARGWVKYTSSVKGDDGKPKSARMYKRPPGSEPTASFSDF